MERRLNFCAVLQAENSLTINARGPDVFSLVSLIQQWPRWMADGVDRVAYPFALGGSYELGLASAINCRAIRQSSEKKVARESRTDESCVKCLHQGLRSRKLPLPQADFAALDPDVASSERYELGDSGAGIFRSLQNFTVRDAELFCLY